MDKILALKMMERIALIDNALNDVASHIELVSNEDEKMELRRSIANLMGLVYSDLMRPIIRLYPELDPDQ
jgi:hypothetical protein